MSRKSPTLPLSRLQASQASHSTSQQTNEPANPLAEQQTSCTCLTLCLRSDCDLPALRAPAGQLLASHQARHRPFKLCCRSHYVPPSPAPILSTRRPGNQADKSASRPACQPAGRPTRQPRIVHALLLCRQPASRHIGHDSPMPRLRSKSEPLCQPSNRQAGKAIQPTNRASHVANLLAGELASRTPSLRCKRFAYVPFTFR